MLQSSMGVNKCSVMNLSLKYNTEQFHPPKNHPGLLPLNLSSTLKVQWVTTCNFLKSRMK